jgi:transposase
MLNFGGRRIFLAVRPADMRKSFDTLASLVREHLSMDPLTGDIFVFVSKNRQRVKLLVWDHSGFWLAAKRLEGGRFAVPQVSLSSAGAHVTMSMAQIQALLEGINVHHATYHQHYRPQRGGAGESELEAAASGR